MNSRKKTAILAGSLAAVATVVGIVLALTIARPKPIDEVAAPGSFGGGGTRLHLAP